MEPEGRDKVIRDRVAAGVLPRTDPRSVWVGYGSGRPCDGCVQPVRPPQREYHADYGPGLSLRLHHACYEFWEVERRRPADPGSG